MSPPNPPPNSSAPKPQAVELTDDQASGLCCVTCSRPGERGMEIASFTTRGGGKVWACKGPCASRVLYLLGFR